jgi:cyclopropane-fatty-acyl-phospholipid synthase
MLNLGIKLTELGLIPESVLRLAIKKLLKQRLSEIPTNPEQRASQKANFLEELQSSPIALSTDLANEQHYEVPPAFFQQIMGAYLKYSCGWFEENTSMQPQSFRIQLLLPFPIPTIKLSTLTILPKLDL